MPASRDFPMGPANAAGQMQILDHLLIIRGLILQRVRLRYIDHPGEMLLVFLRPTIICLMHYFIFSVTNRAMPNGVPVESFVWAAFTIWFTFQQVWGAVKGSRSAPGIHFPGISGMHVRIAIVIWPVLLNSLFCFLSVLLMITFGDNIPVPSILLTALVLAITAFLGLGFGLVVGALGRAIPLLEPFLHMFPYFLLLGSGLYFSMATIPPVMQHIMVWCPTLHLVEYERHAFDPGYPVGLVSLWYPTYWAIGLLALGLALSKRFR
jgi:capsular polysaccharide transport system permease protein